FFFFSSSRRHTRFSRDWSSDVCSSDLGFKLLHPLHMQSVEFFFQSRIHAAAAVDDVFSPVEIFQLARFAPVRRRAGEDGFEVGKIGRASCRGGWRGAG